MSTDDGDLRDEGADSSNDIPFEGSVFFFPLRSNVQYFDTPENYFRLIERIKQVALLYDHLIFQEGVYNAIVWDRGSFDFWTPYDGSKLEDLEKMRHEHKPVGGESFLTIQAGDSQPVSLFSGEAQRRFFSEFHSVTNREGIIGLPWVHFNNYELTDHGKKTASDLNQLLSKDFGSISEGFNSHARKRMLSNLCQDLTVISDIDGAGSVDPMYAPILHNKTRFQQASGFKALQVAVPNFADLDWETILSLREKDCLIEFRNKLSTIEDEIIMASNTTPATEFDYQLMIHQAIMNELLREIASLRPKVGEVVAGAILDLVFGMFPIPGFSTAITAARDAALIEDANKSWVAAFLRLRPIM
jgi:hypothetical protein